MTRSKSRKNQKSAREHFIEHYDKNPFRFMNMDDAHNGNNVPRDDPRWETAPLEMKLIFNDAATVKFKA